jgi:hypothetical protein
LSTIILLSSTLLFAQGTISSVTSASSSYNDFDDVAVRLTATANYNFFVYISYRPQKLISGNWTDLNAQDYYGPYYTSGYWSVSNKSINVFRGEVYSGTFYPLQIDPAGDGTYRIEVANYVDFDPVVTGHSSSFTVYDTQAPSAPSGLSRSIVNYPTCNPRVTWSRNPEGDVDYYEIWKKKQSDWYFLANTGNLTYYVDTDETGASYQAYFGSITVWYKVRAIDFNDNESDFSSSVKFNVFGSDPPDKIIDPGAPQIAIQNKTPTISDAIILGQNYPNPFNPRTSITFVIPNDTNAKLTIYSINGEIISELINGFLEKGFHTVEWNGTNQNGSPVSTSIYIYELIAGNQRLAKKMFLAK